MRNWYPLAKYNGKKSEYKLYWEHELCPVPGFLLLLLVSDLELLNPISFSLKTQNRMHRVQTIVRDNNIIKSSRVLILISENCVFRQFNANSQDEITHGDIPRKLAFFRTPNAIFIGWCWYTHESRYFYDTHHLWTNNSRCYWAINLVNYEVQTYCWMRRVFPLLVRWYREIGVARKQIRMVLSSHWFIFSSLFLSRISTSTVPRVWRSSVIDAPSR